MDLAQHSLDAFTDGMERAERFLALAHKYTGFTVLTDEMILAFIDRIEVGAPDRSSSERLQSVKIYFQYIGRVKRDAGKNDPLRSAPPAVLSPRMS